MQMFLFFQQDEKSLWVRTSHKIAIVEGCFPFPSLMKNMHSKMASLFIMSKAKYIANVCLEH